MNFFPKVLTNTALQVLGRGIVVIVTLVVTAILTRTLGASGYGGYIFITAILFLFTSIGDWGTGIISVREAAKKESLQAKIFGSALTFRFFLSLCLFFLFNFLIRVLPQFKGLVLPATIASFLLFPLSLRSSFQIIFQTKLRFKRLVLVEVFSSVAFLLFIVWFVKIPSLSTVFWFLFLSSFLASCLGAFLAFRLARFNFCPDTKILRIIFWEALPTGALLFLFSVYNRVDIFILKSLKGSEAVGIYGLSYKVHENLVLGAAYLLNVLLPIISRLAKKPQARLALVYKKTFDVLVLASIGILGIVLPLSGLIIQIVGGASFLSSVLTLRILVLATVFSYFNHLTGYTLIALGKQRVSLFVAALALLVNVFLNLIFIPRFSFFGAAGVTVATEGFVFALTSLYLAKRFNLSPSFSFWQTAKELVSTRGKIF